MATEVRTPPKGYPHVSPYLCVDRGTAAIDFYKRVFKATERMRMLGPDGKVGHAELQIGDSVLMLSDEFPEMGTRSPRTVGGTAVVISVYVDDVDAVYATALDAGATSVKALKNQFYGDRTGQFEDPFGHRWSIATHIEDVSPDEMARRAKAMTAQA
jgi:PhnB protein